jgi:uncharacterized protein involved in outer membrane biogenesis
MKMSRRKIIWSTLLFIILIFLGRFLIFSFSLNSLKPIIEDELSWIFEMQTTISGNVNASLLPTFSVNLEDVSLNSKDGVSIQIEKAEITIPLTSMFGSDVQIQKLRIRNPVVSILNKSIDSTISIQTEEIEATDSLKWVIDLVDVNITNGNFYYYDENFGDTVIIQGIDISSESIYARGDMDTLDMGDIKIIGFLSMKQVQINEMILDQVKLDVDIRDKKITISHQSQASETQLHSGEAIIDFSSDVPSYSFRQDILQFNIEHFLSGFSDDTLVKGIMDFSAKLHFSGKNASDRWLSSSGEMSLTGKDLIVEGFDLDAIVDKYTRSQKFNLVDVGALFLAGPVGIAVTKGRDFADLLIANKGDSTLVYDFISLWELKAGKLKAKDVAFSTGKNRIALHGGLSIWQQRYDSLNFALVNKYGCAVFQQQLNGSFEEPEASNVKVVKALFGPIRNIFTGKKCKETFYEGSVQPVDAPE